MNQQEDLERMMNHLIVSIEQAIEDIQKGRMIILVDDEKRENEGDLCCAAELVTPEIINFMATYGRGLICLSLTEEKADALGLKPMVRDNKSPFGTAFTVSIDAYKGVKTGISAQDRAQTILTAIREDAGPDDLSCPGHVFPLRARKGGVLERPGQTEGSVDLAMLAGLCPSGVICEVMKDDGTMARMTDLVEFAEKHALNIATIAALIEYRMKHEPLLHRREERCMLPSWGGEWRAILYTSECMPGEIFIVIAKGNIEPTDTVLVRLHRECFTGDLLGSVSCDSGNQLHRAMEMIAEEGKGVVLYVGQEGRGIGLHKQLRASGAIDEGWEGNSLATQTLQFKGELLRCGIWAQILLDLGIRRVREITARPQKIMTYEKYGIDLIGRVRI